MIHRKPNKCSNSFTVSKKKLDTKGCKDRPWKMCTFTSTYHFMLHTNLVIFYQVTKLQSPLAACFPYPDGYLCSQIWFWLFCVWSIAFRHYIWMKWWLVVHLLNMVVKCLMFNCSARHLINNLSHFIAWELFTLHCISYVGLLLIYLCWIVKSLPPYR